MNVVLASDLTLGLLGLALGSIRWLRVAQREHYLSGSVATFARRWWFATPLNGVLVVAATASWAAMSFWPPIGLLAGVVTCLGPVGLGLHGRTSELAWTPRLGRVAAGAATVWVVVAAISAVVAGLLGVAVATLFLAIFSPLAIDLVLDLLRPIEERAARRFVEQAKEALEHVHPRVVAITGSYGKTSTKGYLAHLLGGRFNVLASPRSFNNQAGLARTINELLLPGTDVLIAEMGTYGLGEIKRMVSWLPPEIAVITAIGPVHLERFETLEKTLKAKSEITEGARLIVLNADDPYLRDYADELEASEREVLRCSAVDPDADIAVIDRGTVVELFHSGVSLGTVDLGAVRLSIALSNVACAAAVALALDVEPDEVLAALTSLPVTENRLSIVKSEAGVTVIDDTYNSNPRGAALALEALKVATRSGRRAMVVTPGMVELGPEQFDANVAFAAAAAEIVTHFVVVGRTNRSALLEGLEAAALDGHDCAVSLALDRDEAVEIAREELSDGDVVLYENDLPDHYS